MNTANNLHVCLVHENSGVVVDLINNLKRLDPSSDILIYTGKQLSIPEFFAKDCIIYPEPREVQWGHLGHFVFDCLEFMLTGSWKCITIVDSDQLLMKTNYSSWVASNISKYDVITSRIAYEPSQCSKPLVDFIDSCSKTPEVTEAFGRPTEEAFCSCFNPGTVYSRKLAEKATEKLSHNLIQKLIDNGAYAEEEPIFITLARSFDMPILDCAAEHMIRWVEYWSEADVFENLGDRYWVHPIKREINDPARKVIRDYSKTGNF